jgi:hypothetical protein
MTKNGSELPEPTLQQMVESYREHMLRGRDLVKLMIHKAAEQERKEWQRQRAVVESVHREALEQGRVAPIPAQEAPTIPYMDLPDGSPASPIAREWNLYRREVGRLLTEGNENRWVLIKSDQIIGIWDTEEEARAVALHKFLMQPCLIQQVRSHEPVVSMSPRFWGCQS